MRTITPFLWFNDNAEEAMQFYVSVFKNAKAGDITPGPGGKAMGVSFEIEGQKFIGLNGGPHFKFTEAISFFISCDTQEDVDELWEKLSDGGEKGRCGWLKDKFGLSWQVVPSTLSEMINDKDPEKAKRTVEAMMKMDKLDISILKKAHEG
jgi:predicted 3-demethylubiquinone-9 3-methyltransferase (glyoxalase superfamily)